MRAIAGACAAIDDDAGLFLALALVPAAAPAKRETSPSASPEAKEKSR